MPWAFKDLLDGNNQNAFRQWLDAQPVKVRLKLDSILKHLLVSPNLNSKFLKKIGGVDGVFEVRITFDKVQYRPLGGYGPNNHEFTFVMGAIEHNDNIRPPSAFKTAEGLIADVRNKKRNVCDHVYEKPLKDTP